MNRNIIRIYISIICVPIIALLLGVGSQIAGKLQKNDSITVTEQLERKLPIYSVDIGTEEKKIALTFDAAWGAEDFMNIMEVLDRHNVKVTFFMTGSWVEDNPEYVKLLAQKGHDLGNHTNHHYDMTGITKEEQRKEILEVHDRVKEIAGVEMELFRPPYGAYDDSVIEAATECGYYAVQWSVDSLDWKDYGADAIVQTVCNHKQLEPGAIILCHNGAKYTAQALDAMMTNLEEQGYSFVKLSDLLIKENYEIDINGKQHTTNALLKQE